MSKIKELAAEIASYMAGSPFENHERILALVKAAKKEELERIQRGSKYLDCSDENDAFSYTLSFWHVPASILDSKEVQS